MLNQYLKTFLRLSKKRLLFTISLFSALAISLSASYICYTIAIYETKFEEFNENHNEIYRVSRHETRNGEILINSALTFPALSKLLLTEFPEIKQAGRLMKRQGVVRVGENSYNEYNIFNADNEIIKILSVKIILGDGINPITKPNTAIISESYAKKYFGENEPINKTILLNKEIYTINGIFRDYPPNSHIKFDILFSYSTFSSFARFEESWAWSNFYTYLVINPYTDAEKLKSKVFDYFQGKQEKLNIDNSVKTYFTLIPIREIHLSSSLSNELSSSGDFQTVSLLIVTSIVLLVISFLNYGNIAIANSIDKVKEIEIRKLFGADRKNIVVQSVFETFIAFLSTIILSTIILFLVITYFRDFFQFHISISFLMRLSNIFTFISICLLGFMIVGIFSIGQWLRSNYQNHKLNGLSIGFRRLILTMQLTAAFIVCNFTFILIKQFNHLKDGDLAFNPKGIFVLDPPNLTDSLYETKLTAFKNEMSSYSKIENFTITSSVPGEPILDFYENSVRRVNDNEIVKEKIYFIMVDENYFNTFEINIKNGRTFDSKNLSDEGNAIINEKAAEILGYKNPSDAVNGTIQVKKGYYNIIGVIQNYHHESLKKEIDPIIFILNTDLWGFYCFKGDVLSVDAIGYLRNKWKALVPESPFDYSILEDRYERQYQSEKALFNSFSIFTFITVLMIILGLFGVISLTIKKQLKSLAIKKVLGASLFRLTQRISIEFFILITIAFFVSLPISFYVINSWLMPQASRVDVTLDILVIPIVASLIIVLINVSLIVTVYLKNIVSVIRSE